MLQYTQQTCTGTIPARLNILTHPETAVRFTHHGVVAGNALADLGPYLPGDWITLSLAVEVPEQRYTAQVNQGPIVCLTLADDSCRAVEYLSLRTGSWRGCTELAVTPVEHDHPLPVPAVFYIANVSILPA